MNEIVKYHNDLNDKIVFPDFKEQELNIFANLLCEFKERETETLTFSADEVSKFFGSAYNAGALGFIMREMAERLRTLGFKWTRTEFDRKREIETITTAYITMFPTFYVKCEKNPKDTSADAEKYPIFKSLEVRINPDFQYLLSEINSNFTRFELAEFMSLSGKYTKNLYRLLKQYRQTGWLQMEWQDFQERLHIPNDYEMCNIDQRILKPAIRELSEPRNLFNQDRVIFENLKYTKIKKGGNKVTAIRFDFKPEQIQELESQTEKAKPTNTKEPNLKAYCGLYVDIPTTERQVTGKITNIYEIDEKIIMEIMDENFNTTNLPFNNLESLEKCVKSFQI